MKECICATTIKTAHGEVYCLNHGTIKDPLDKYNIIVDRRIDGDRVRFLFNELHYGRKYIARIMRITVDHVNSCLRVGSEEEE